MNSSATPSNSASVFCRGIDDRRDNNKAEHKKSIDHLAEAGRYQSVGRCKNFAMSEIRSNL